MRYKFFRIKTHGNQAVGFYEIDGLAQPVRGVVAGDPGDYTTFHRGWFVTPPNEEGFVVQSPPTNEEEAIESEELLAFADAGAKKIRRRIEDRLRKIGIEGLLFSNPLNDPHLFLLNERDLAEN